ncbi:MAG: flagellar biosynthesis anti-sigma factor FlgM [Nitrospirae bacterium CG_4_9_14_3_um_filter_53_35]|nr:MAG: flagellar biosynthesis anti-sigma factor FlgM [Nitrospirae bacterium CG2_30_53_67]PIS36451.1 MAG: flagellar biosynthesis anti-sigma factor FlgM [Nitrospirae bacterium CG08_land_8_20_14_0_20_52_24]PIV83109.1 MAG: flagellar biosynthesis anti-sigma factor FlgM [Nitrospirae bacterium CG17_big_fil_post_rev_8_21_14_2_50_50_9]PIW85514.1 MAG: flagellar biosynthesis anti-sigma factor FlgM [Nitrospirae bacterium CG_4_8_14_3_um_filter_50_41]PIX85837.1 MAG: flagellar biosynthesis anti-sigma factor 
MRRSSSGKIDSQDPRNKSDQKKAGCHPGKNNDVNAQDTSAPLKKGPLHISGKSEEVERVCEIVRKTPDIRAKKVESIKRAIHAGTYIVSCEKVAAKILEEIRKEIVGL